MHISTWEGAIDDLFKFAIDICEYMAFILFTNEPLVGLNLFELHVISLDTLYPTWETGFH